MSFRFKLTAGPGPAFCFLQPVEGGRSKFIVRGSVLLLTLLAVLLAGCHSPQPTPPLHRFDFNHPAMGTLFSVSLFAPDEITARNAADAAFHRIDALEDIMSDYQADSELMQLCDRPAGTPVHVSADLFDVLQRAQRISELSGGAFDVTVGPYVRLWRFERKRKVMASPAEMAAARAAVGWRHLRLDPRARTVRLLVPNMRLDLGGIAKGYAADQALKLLKGRGLARALVAASGDIAVGDPPPGQRGWKVGITPIDVHTNLIAQTVLLHNVGISTSGDTEQAIEINGVRYSHILDPGTGLGLTNRIQASVIAPDATASDALATTVCVLGPARSLVLADSLPGTSTSILVKDESGMRSFVSRRFPLYTRVRRP